MRFLLCCLLLPFLSAACQGGPTAADVAADRARWTAVRDFSALGAPTDAERAAFASLLATWDTKLTADEAAANKPRDFNAIVVELARVYGDAALQVEISPRLKAKLPAPAFNLLDKNGDGVLTLTELTSVNWNDPVFAVVVIDTVRQLLQRHK